jgi:hypothetical protein
MLIGYLFPWDELHSWGRLNPSDWFDKRRYLSQVYMTSFDGGPIAGWVGYDYYVGHTSRRGGPWAHPTQPRVILTLW